MTQIDVRLGIPDDVAAAVSVYERSNLARRHGDWPSRSARVAQVRASLHDDTSQFLIGRDGAEAVAMAHVRAFRAGGGNGHVIPGTSFLNLIYVPPDYWGKGIGGTTLDAVIDEAAQRGCHQIYLWTHEHQNERAIACTKAADSPEPGAPRTILLGSRSVSGFAMGNRLTERCGEVCLDASGTIAQGQHRPPPASLNR